MTDYTETYVTDEAIYSLPGENNDIEILETAGKIKLIEDFEYSELDDLLKDEDSVQPLDTKTVPAISQSHEATELQKLYSSVGDDKIKALKAATDRERDEHPTFSFVNDAAR